MKITFVRKAKTKIETEDQNIEIKKRQKKEEPEIKT